MYAELTPFDTVFFRDGSPFTMGQETWGQSRFPPPPSVVYGALRTRHFAEHPGRLPDASGPDDPTRDARLTAFHLRDAVGPLYPMPRDLVAPKGADEPGQGTPVRRLRRTALPEGAAGLGRTPQVLSHPEEVETVRNSMVREGALGQYLRGEEGAFTSYHLYEDHLAYREPKIGIRMDRDTRAADDGFLYRVGLRRLGEDLSFGVGIDALSLSDRGLLKLGGESKPASYERISDTPPVPTPPRDRIADTSTFVLYLATPAIFDQGWVPGAVDPDTLRATVNGATVRLEAAAVGKPGAIGGWDVAAGRPKPMDRTVPAGSVYYFSLEDGSAQDVIDALHNERISEARAQAGFGHAFVGVAPA